MFPSVTYEVADVFLFDLIRAHQGFGWVGEWANMWLVLDLLFFYAISSAIIYVKKRR